MDKSAKHLTQELLERFQRNLKARNKRKTTRGRRRFEIHATDIKKLCLRQFLILYSLGVPYQSEHKAHPEITLLTFEIGHALEDIGLDLLEAVKPAPMALKIRDIYLIGSPDGCVRIDGKNYLLECKSIKKEDYQLLEKPLADHELQLGFYLWLDSKRKERIYEEIAFFLYIPKQQVSPLIKIFPYTLYPSNRKLFDSIVSSIRLFLKKGVLPERVCVSPNASLARNCPVVEVCFKK